MIKLFRYIFSFTCIFFMNSSVFGTDAYLSPRSWVDTIIQKFAKPDQFGVESLPDEKVSFIRGIAKELGVTQKFEIRKMNSHAMRTFGLYNALAYFDRYLFVSEHFFDKLDFHEQRFLIGHELMHIKQCCAYRHFSLFCGLASFNLVFLISTIILGQQKNKKLALLSGTINLVGLMILQPLVRAHARMLEKEADLYSAKILGEVQGGISFLEKFSTLTKDHPLQGQYDYSSWFKRIFASHPSFPERQKYLKNIVNRQEFQSKK
ncbi:MAG TPA: M48 family metallopeptidase [Candidatus Babeliales bacterium]|nr:M48 family metallopeptidase [Candidatus Babeliales bacterium]